MSVQMSFAPKTWEVGDTVEIEGRQCTILDFHSMKKKVRVAAWDAITNEKINPWYGIDELPPYPHSENPESSADIPAVTEETDETPSTLPNDPDTDTKPMAVASDGPRALDILATGPKHGARDPEEEIFFHKGHKRKMYGTTLTVEEPTVRGKYMCRVFMVNGGTRQVEKTWQEIRDWGNAVKTESTDSPSITIEAGSSTQTDKPTVETIPAVAEPDVEERVDAPLVVPMVEMAVVHCVMRDAEGFHTLAAARTLTKRLSEGWALQHVDYQTMWIPAHKSRSESYVETVVYWTLTRPVSPKGIRAHLDTGLEMYKTPDNEWKSFDVDAMSETDRTEFLKTHTPVPKPTASDRFETMYGYSPSDVDLKFFIDTEDIEDD